MNTLVYEIKVCIKFIKTPRNFINSSLKKYSWHVKKLRSSFEENYLKIIWCFSLITKTYLKKKKKTVIVFLNEKKKLKLIIKDSNIKNSNLNSNIKIIYSKYYKYKFFKFIFRALRKFLKLFYKNISLKKVFFFLIKKRRFINRSIEF